MAAYYELVGDLVAEAGGSVVKFMGDAGLLIYPAAEAERAVVGLRQLKIAGDTWLTDHAVPCRHVIKAHVGSVYCGPMGTRQEKRFDVFGETVNTTALLPSHGLSITPALFRQLGPESRKLFKKHTPPVTYIPVEERHQD
jgi:class 3 adenylate cyclase